MISQDQWISIIGLHRLYRFWFHNIDFKRLICIMTTTKNRHGCVSYQYDGSNRFKLIRELFFHNFNTILMIYHRSQSIVTIESRIHSHQITLSQLWMIDNLEKEQNMILLLFFCIFKLILEYKKPFSLIWSPLPLESSISQIDNGFFSWMESSVVLFVVWIDVISSLGTSPRD